MDELGKLAAHLYQKPSFSNSSALKALYAEKRLSKSSPPGLDVLEMTRLLEEQEEAISLGDRSRIEEMLITQAHVLQAIFSTYVTKAASAAYLDEVQAYMHLALKAQNQCRQALSTLTDFAKPNKTTFIAQQNNAIAQQVRQDTCGNSQTIANELMEIPEHEPDERLAEKATADSIPAHPRMETVD